MLEDIHLRSLLVQPVPDLRKAAGTTSNWLTKTAEMILFLIILKRRTEQTVKSQLYPDIFQLTAFNEYCNKSATLSDAHIITQLSHLHIWSHLHSLLFAWWRLCLNKLVGDVQPIFHLNMKVLWRLPMQACLEAVIWHFGNASLPRGHLFAKYEATASS